MEVILIYLNLIFRNIENPLKKFTYHDLPIVSKIWIAPSVLKKIFGNGAIPSRNKRATLEFDFEDTNMDKFLIYDYA